MWNRGIIGLLGAACVTVGGAASAWADGPHTTSSFLDIPGALFFDVDNFSASAPLGPFVFPVGAVSVTITSTSASGNSPDYYGTYLAPSTWIVPRDMEADPGNANAYFQTSTSYLYTILDFDTPLTGFGATFGLRSRVGGSDPYSPDTIHAYDGPGGTGNLIASVTTDDPPAADFKIGFDFVGIYVDGSPRIRSVILAGGPLGMASEIMFTGFALAIAESVPPCASDVNGDGESDILDFLDFFDSFGECSGLPGPCAGGSGVDADYNGDTLVDILDFLDFLDAFGTGCD
ncbi:MAG: hypothetical protein KF902_14770 [Phycisphaeraceae bacterium]|nr:hypothetical protein [Phycisphaeraceae bacterium]